MCNTLIDTIEYFSPLKEFEIIAYKINPDHIHLAIITGEAFNVSEIIHTIKRNSSININKLMHKNDAFGDYQKLKRFEDQPVYAKMWERKFNNRPNYFLPRFSWQKGFIESLITSRRELANVVQYVSRQHLKHQLKNKFYCIINESIVEKANKRLLREDKLC